MSEVVFAYQHPLPAGHYAQLCALPEVIARYSPGANGTKVLENMRRDIADLPTDANGNRLFELDPDDQTLVLRMLDWAAHRSGDKRFAWLARDLREGADASDRAMDGQSNFN